MNNLYWQKEKKIPLPVAILIIFFMVGGIVNFFKTQPATKTQASGIKISKLEILNLTDNSAVIFWQTDIPSLGWVYFGTKENQLNQMAFDIRDIKNQKKQWINHFVPLKNLTPNQTYFFLIANEKGIIKKGNQPFSFKTKLQRPKLTNLSPATGKVYQKNGLPLKNGIVILKIEEAEPLGDLTKETGEYLVPLYYITKKDSFEFFQPSFKTPVIIEIFDEEKNYSLIKTTFEKTTPLPQPVIIGKNYDFTNDNEKVLSAVEKNEKIILPKITIIFPKENAVISGKKPLFKGTALPQKKIKVVINPEKQIFEIYSDKDGVWSLIPFYELKPGKYQLIVTTNNEKENPITLTRNFIIGKSGEAVLGEATPSADLSPTSTPTPFQNPTSTPTSVFTPTPTTVYVASPTLSPPISGINFLYIVILSISLIMVGLGLVFVF